MSISKKPVEVTEKLLCETIDRRCKSEGWQLKPQQGTSTKMLSAPEGDIRRDWATRWHKCRTLNVLVPSYAIELDPPA